MVISGVGWFRRVGLVCVAVVGGWSGGLAGQAVEPLGPPDAVAAEGFTSVFDVAELDDGRVLMTDNRDRIVALIDFEAGSVTPIGREGQGPREYLGAFGIVARPDGSFGVYDPRQNRLLLVSAEGDVVGTESFVRPSHGSVSNPRAFDANGWAVMDSRSLYPEGGLKRESTLYRWHLASGRTDSIGVFMNYAPHQRGRGITPMPVGDAWSAMPDGSILVVHAEDYRAEWRGGEAGDAQGDPLPYSQVEVGQAERDEWIRQMLSRSGGSATMASADPAAERRRTESRVREYRSRLEEERFPEVLPPFEPGYVPASPWGDVWIKVRTESTPARSVFDVIGRDARRGARVSIEGSARVVGFGSDAVYVAVKDEFDLEWLQRYPRARTGG